MAKSLISPFPPPFTASGRLPGRESVFFRNQDRVLMKRNKNGENALCACLASNSAELNEFCRRDLILFGVSSTLFMAFPNSGLCEETEEVKMDSIVDEINAYTYLLPMQSKKLKFKWAESRKPERYSSAAPLSPDARLRIVSERVDFIDNLIISVSVTSLILYFRFTMACLFLNVYTCFVQIGPPNLQFLKSKEKSTWGAKEVADSVLSDKSALRVTSSQRVAESSILDAHSSEVDGEPYWYYEYLVRKSPTKSAQESNNYRHYVASTAERDGFLYTLNASTLSKQWDTVGPILQKTIASFRLLPGTENYVPPSKDPWRFW
ncbi:hypothetical protein QQ045_004947 [Rhodiola kirilowii]